MKPIVLIFLLLLVLCLGEVGEGFGLTWLEDIRTHWRGFV